MECSLLLINADKLSPGYYSSPINSTFQYAMNYMIVIIRKFDQCNYNRFSWHVILIEDAFY